MATEKKPVIDLTAEPRFQDQFTGQEPKLYKAEPVEYQGATQPARVKSMDVDYASLLLQHHGRPNDAPSAPPAGGTPNNPASRPQAAEPVREDPMVATVLKKLWDDYRRENSKLCKRYPEQKSIFKHAEKALGHAMISKSEQDIKTFNEEHQKIAAKLREFADGQRLAENLHTLGFVVLVASFFPLLIIPTELTFWIFVLGVVGGACTMSIVGDSESFNYKKSEANSYTNSATAILDFFKPYAPSIQTEKSTVNQAPQYQQPVTVQTSKR